MTEEWRWALLVLAPLLDSETANVVTLSAAISACEKQKQRLEVQGRVENRREVLGGGEDVVSFANSGGRP